MNFKAIKAWFDVQLDLDSAIDELGSEIDQFKAHASTLELKLEQANRTIEELAHYKVLHELDTDRSKAIESFSFDFSAVRVFSVERAMREGELTTIISWLNSDDTTHEWYYGCNQDAHEELVRQFKKYKGI